MEDGFQFWLVVLGGGLSTVGAVLGAWAQSHFQWKKENRVRLEGLVILMEQVFVDEVAQAMAATGPLELPSYARCQSLTLAARHHFLSLAVPAQEFRDAWLSAMTVLTEVAQQADSENQSAFRRLRNLRDKDEPPPGPATVGQILGRFSNKHAPMVQEALHRLILQREALRLAIDRESERWADQPTWWDKFCGPADSVRTGFQPK